MSTPENQEFKRREAELLAKQRELRLRELEIEIYEEQKAKKSKVIAVEPPLSQTRRYDSKENSLQRLGRKIVKYTKFSLFVIVGFAIVKTGFLIGMSITYLVLVGIIAAIGYQIFLKED